jgi:ligand-binding sensor domain-containing protein
MLRWRSALLVLLAASSHGARGASAATPAVFTNTLSVQAIAHAQGAVWVATQGGVEEYDPATLARRRLFTTNDGLPTSTIRRLEVEGADLVAIADGQRCVFGHGKFVCEASARLSPEVPQVPEIFLGSRVTARLTLGGREILGTAGKGLWLLGKRPRLLSPGGGLCGNHVMAMAEFGGQIWLGTFDEGLCRFDGSKFVTAPVPFRMVNDLVATKDGLYVATTVGLYRTRDGRRFDRILLFDSRGINDLAADGDTLWATSPATLWKIPIGRRGLPRGYWQPAGSRSLQAVDAVSGQVWLATEDRGLLRMSGKTFTIIDRAAGMPSSWVVDVTATSDGGAYAATLRDGLVYVDKDGRVRKINNLPDNWLLHVSQGKQRLWVGTQGGAASLTGDTIVALLPSLPNPCVHAILETSTAIWAATEGGVARYDLPAP